MISVTLDIQGELTEESERIQRLPRVVEQFALANYGILSSWMNPVSKNRVKVTSSTEATLLSGDRTHITYHLTDDIDVGLLVIDDGKYLVEFTHQGRTLYDPLTPSALELIPVQEAASAIESEADLGTVENIDLLRLERPPIDGMLQHFSNYVEAPTAHAALEKVVLQKMSNSRPFTTTTREYGQLTEWQRNTRNLRQALRASLSAEQGSATIQSSYRKQPCPQCPRRAERRFYPVPVAGRTSAARC